MKLPVSKTTALAAVLCLLLSGVAVAQSTAPKANPAAEKELAAAQVELQRAAKRVAELSRQLGHGGDPIRRVEKRVIRKPVIGVLLAPDATAGVRIAGVTPDSAAAKAGLRSGDRLTAIAGSEILGSDGRLRVVNARKLLGGLDTYTPVRLGYLRDGKAAVVNVTPKIGEQVIVLSGADDSNIEKRVRIHADRGHAFEFEVDGMEGIIAPHASSQIHEEIIRIGPDGGCKGANCRTPMLMSAFRWNGLNLASLDPQLGRYFGTDKGVLVLSTGELKGLQSGDVIQNVDGKPVDSPRDVMAALRGKPANAGVAVGYLRDRKPATTNITVPGVMHRLPLPPQPPMPPKAPKPPLPPTPPRATGIAVPPAPPVAVEAQRFVFISAEDGERGRSLLDAEEGATRLIEDIEVETR